MSGALAATPLMIAAVLATIINGAQAVAVPSPASAWSASATDRSTGAIITSLDSHLTRAPYLTDLVGLGVAVNFATDRSSTSARVSYGPVAEDGTCAPTASGTPTRRAITVGTVPEYQWTAHLTFPQPGSYCYRVALAGVDLLDTNPSPTFTTQSQPGDTTPFTFDVFGDWGVVGDDQTNADQAALMSQIAASGARFAIALGDNGYPSGSQSNYGDLQQTGPNISGIFGPERWTVAGLSTPLFTVVGNHGLAGSTHTDITTWTQQQAVTTSGGRYQDDLYPSINGSAPAHYGSEWYAFTAGTLRCYVLDAAWGDTNVGFGTVYANDAVAHWSAGSPEVEWLKSDLQANQTTPLKFAFFHYPLYADNPQQTSDTSLDGPDNLEGLLASYNVQIVFNGHAHLYERNLPSGPGMPTTYVSGGGGGRLQPVGPCSPLDAYAIGWSPTKSKGTACGAASPPVAARQVYHFLKVTVSGTSVTVEPTNAQGQVFDAQTYQFGNGANAAPAGTVTTRSGSGP